MAEFIRKHWAYLIAALLLHVLFAGVFGLTMLRMSRNAPPPQLAIQAVVVDQSLLSRANRQQQRERERRRDQAIQREREQAAEQQRREQEETARREAEQRAEQERQVELKQREEADQKRLLEEQQVRERQEAERKREAEAERERKAEAERQRVAEIERKQKEAEQKRRAAEEMRAQEAREDELRRQLEEEEGRDQAANSGLLNQYIAMIEQRVVRNWNRPASARPGLECEVRVAQTPGGAVLSVQLGRCNGDAAVRQSIENAVMRSSPLPPPPDPRLFERNLVLVFKPLE
jgi:colicin import membrane protein